MSELLKQAEEKMQKSIEHLINEFKVIRTDRASPYLVENIKVSCYGALSPLKQVASISIPDEKTILIKPFDPSILQDIEKAILKSDIGITPQNDGKIIRLVLPPLSEERRKQLSSFIKEFGEKTKISIRNIRRDTNKQIDEKEKKKEISEDEKYRLKDRMQKLTETHEKKVEEIVSKKQKEVLGL
jgi:ribosome recycling factor